MGKEHLQRLLTRHRDHHPKRQRMLDVLRAVKVSEVMRTKVETVPTTMGLAALARLFQGRPHACFPVLDPHGALHGMLTRLHLTQALTREATDRPTASDMVTPPGVSVYPDEPVATAVLRLVAHDLRCLPVVARGQPRCLLGVLRRQDVIRACTEGVQRHRQG